MYEKILQKLKEQRGETSNLSDRSLEDMAKFQSKFITEDSQLEDIDFSDVIESLDGNINHYTASAVKTAVSKVQKKDEPKPPSPGKGKEQEENEQPEWVKKLMEQNESLAEKIARIENDKTVSQRKERLQKELKDVPSYFSKPYINQVEKLSFGDDDEFDTYVNEIKSLGKEFVQSAKEQGLNLSAPTGKAEPPKDDGQTPELRKAREIINKNKQQ